VKRWHRGDQLRWTASGLLEAERKFRKVKSLRELANLHRKLNPQCACETCKQPRLTQQGVGRVTCSKSRAATLNYARDNFPNASEGVEFWPERAQPGEDTSLDSVAV